MPGYLDMPGGTTGARNGLPFLSHTWGAPVPNANLSFGASDRNALNAPGAMQTPLQLGAGPIRFGSQLPTAPAPNSGDADIIPTAIVIKNIPFNIKREQLLHIIVRTFG